MTNPINFIHRGQHRRRNGERRGAVFVEVLIAIIPLLLIFLGITQLSILRMGKLVVQHSANRAVRAAVVIVDDDPQYYNMTPRGDLSNPSSNDSSERSDFASLDGELTDVQTAQLSLISSSDGSSNARLERIRSAAYHPLAVLAPPLAWKASLHDEVASSPWARLAFGALVFNRGAAAVTVRNPGSGELKERVEHHEAITVRVAFLMPCGVPLVSAFICHHGHDLGKLRLRELFEESSLLAGLISTSEEAEATMNELQYVSSPLQRDTMLALGGRYRLLVAEATLPNQGANYH